MAQNEKHCVVTAPRAQFSEAGVIFPLDKITCCDVFFSLKAYFCTFKRGAGQACQGDGKKKNSEIHFGNFRLLHSTHVISPQGCWHPAKRSVIDWPGNLGVNIVHSGGSQTPHSFYSIYSIKFLILKWLPSWDRDFRLIGENNCKVKYHIEISIQDLYLGLLDATLAPITGSSPFCVM